LAGCRAKHKKNKLSLEQISALESLDGFVWNTGRITFDKHIIKLRKLIKSTGELPMSCNKDKTVKSHYKFLSKCRTKHKKNKLSPEQISALESLNGFVWSGSSKK